MGDDFELTLLVYWISAHSIVLSPVLSPCPAPSGLIAKCLSSHLKSDRLYCLNDCRGLKLMPGTYTRHANERPLH